MAIFFLRLFAIALAASGAALVAPTLVIGWLAGNPHVTAAMRVGAALGMAGGVLGIAVTVRTNRSRARQYQERLRAAVRSLHEAVITTDARGTITAMNRRAESITGWPENEAVGRPVGAVFLLVDAHSHRPVVNPVVRALYKNVVVGPSRDTLLVGKDGGERPIHQLATPIRDAAGRVFAGAVTFRSLAAADRIAAASTRTEPREPYALAHG